MTVYLSDNGGQWRFGWTSWVAVAYVPSVVMQIEIEREEDGRWLADTAALPGVTAYGRTKKQATAAVQALALRLIADRLEHGEALPGPMNVSFIAA